MANKSQTTRKTSNSTKGRGWYWTGRTRDQETKDKIGKAHLGLVYTDESKKKMSISHMGSKNPRARKVVMFNDGNLEIATFGSISDAARATGGTPGEIRYACIKEGRKVNGYYWKFYE